MLQFTLTFASGSRGTTAVVIDVTTSSPPKKQKFAPNAQNDGTPDRSPCCLGESAAAPVLNSESGTPVILHQRLPTETHDRRVNPIPGHIPANPRIKFVFKKKAITLDGHRYRICAETFKRKVNCFCVTCLSDGGGKNLCSHFKQKHKCKECKGKSLCIHGDQRSRCKKCLSSGQGGSGLCKHGREIWRGLCHKCKQ
jgi:hypothetical protein